MRRGPGVSHCGSWVPVPGGEEYDWALRFVCNREPGHAGWHRNMGGWEWSRRDRVPRRVQQTTTATETQRWRVDHPGIGALAYDTEAEARSAAGTAGTLIPPGGAS